MPNLKPRLANLTIASEICLVLTDTPSHLPTVYLPAPTTVLDSVTVTQRESEREREADTVRARFRFQSAPKQKPRDPWQPLPLQ